MHHLLGYFHDFVYRKNFNKKERPSGGILFYYYSELQGKVSVYDNSSENIIWIKRYKGLNDYENNTFVASVYKNLKNSTYTKFNDSKVIDRLEQQLKKLLSSDLILIGGHFNSKTGYITEDSKDITFLLEDYELDRFTVSRNNEHVSINYFDHQLFQRCIAAKLVNSVRYSSRLKNLLSDHKPILLKMSNNNLFQTNKNS